MRCNHVAPGHCVDMSSRLPPYFGQTKSIITLLTRGPPALASMSTVTYTDRGQGVTSQDMCSCNAAHIGRNSQDLGRYESMHSANKVAA